MKKLMRVILILALGLVVVGRTQFFEGRQLAVELDDARPVVADGSADGHALTWR